MILYLRYPYSSGIFFPIVVDVDLSVYWQCSQVFRILRLHKDVGRVLNRTFGRDVVKRSSDLKAAKKCHFYYLTPDQVRILIASSGNHDRRFDGWFEAVQSGRQLMCPRDPVQFRYLTEKVPFAPRGFYADCVELDGEIYVWTDRQGDEGDEEEQPPSVASSTCRFPPPRTEISNVFALTDLLRREPLPTPPETVPEEKEEDPYRMELDYSKSFFKKDPQFGHSYKFHAMKASWLTGSVSVGFWPYLKPAEDAFYLYVPVKKHE